MLQPRRMLSDESGLETVEYAVIAGVIVSGLVAVVAALGVWTLKRYKLTGRFLWGASPGP